MMEAEEDVEMEDEEPVKKITHELQEFIGLLRAPVKTMDVWKMDFGGALAGFGEAIPLIKAAVTAVYEDGTFTLTDAAYVLYNSGCIWSKRVDEVRRLCLQMTELVSSRSNKKSNDNGDGDEDEMQKKTKTKKRTAHPLTMITDDRIEEVEFFQNRWTTQNPNRDRVLAKKIEKLPQDKYLAEAQPRSIGLLQFEKIRSYEDDRGIKGNDWAEYQINTLKLSREGYFPLQQTHPEMYEFRNVFTIDRPRLSDWPVPENPSHNCSFGFDALPNTDDAIPEDGHAAIGGQEDNHASIPGAAADPIGLAKSYGDKKASLGRPGRPQALPNVPFKGKLSIAAEMQVRELYDAQPPQQIEADYFPYKRRNKRILKISPIRPVGAEVVFFQNFWDIHPGLTFYEPRLKKIFQRLRTRLRRVELPAERRGRKRTAEVTFVSSHEMELLGAPMSSPFAELNFGSGKKRVAEDDDDLSDIEFNNDPDDGAEYVETDQPIATQDNGISLGDADHQQFNDFAEMRRQGVFAPPLEYEEDLLNSSSTASGPAVKVDLYEWERRLNRFLEIHEPQTLSFDLDTFGKDLVVNCEKEVGHNMQAVSRIVSRRTTGEVCRSFLSMLDLANKNVLQFGSQKEISEDTVGASSQSQGVSEIGVRIC